MEQFTRTELLLGPQAMKALGNARIIVFGVGGVGSWCVEALARSGVGALTVVDSDTVDISNINRQLVADRNTIGQMKTTVMARRIFNVNPSCHIEGVAASYDSDTSSAFDLDSYDVVVDAIDSVASKAHLIATATRCRHARLVSSMGAAQKADVSKVRTDWFDNVSGCPLARALRSKFRQTDLRPWRKFRCVYSPELVPNKLETPAQMTANGLKRTNGTIVTTTATFGMALAQLAIESILKRNTITC
ncbi:MAG: tRNA threonylcarbamoyladenosine dehydratase [Bacteroidales bacterium]|nr:tRNA threonylcarbamoyladenosine dehydratase [Bacteroidales bacterium]